MSDYRLHYLDQSRKFIRQDAINALSDEEAIAAAKNWRLPRRSELWSRGRLVAKFSPRSMASSGPPN